MKDDYDYPQGNPRDILKKHEEGISISKPSSPREGDFRAWIKFIELKKAKKSEWANEVFSDIAKERLDLFNEIRYWRKKITSPYTQDRAYIKNGIIGLSKTIGEIYEHCQKSVLKSKELPRNQRTKFRRDLREFKKMVKTGSFPKLYDNSIPVGNILIEFFTRKVTPTKTDLIERLKYFGIEVSKSSMDRALDFYQIRHIFADTPGPRTIESQLAEEEKQRWQKENILRRVEADTKNAIEEISQQMTDSSKSGS